MKPCPTHARRRPPRQFPIWIGLILALIGLAGCGGNAPVLSPAPDAPIPARVPPLPFAENYDPSQCGIPTPFGDATPHTVTGTVDGVEIQPIVYLYDSHLRSKITGQVYPGAQVEVQFFQSNPLLNYYLVRTVNVEPAQSGWLPAPFLLGPTGQPVY